jgi:hypothetical protein
MQFHNPLNQEVLRQPGKTPAFESSWLMLNHATTALSSYLCDQVENLRARFAQQANGSHFALTALFQASSPLEPSSGAEGQEQRFSLRCPNGGQCTHNLSG